MHYWKNVSYVLSFQNMHGIDGIFKRLFVERSYANFDIN